MEITFTLTPTCGFCHHSKGIYASVASLIEMWTSCAIHRQRKKWYVFRAEQDVPVTVVNGQVLVGFDRPRLDYMLAAASRRELGAAVADAAAMAAQGRCQVSQGAFVGARDPG